MSHKRKGGLWITLGLLLIAAALALVCYNLYDALRAKQSAWQIISSLEEDSAEESRIAAPAEASALLRANDMHLAGAAELGIVSSDQERQE